MNQESPLKQLRELESNQHIMDYESTRVPNLPAVSRAPIFFGFNVRSEQHALPFWG